MNNRSECTTDAVIAAVHAIGSRLRAIGGPRPWTSDDEVLASLRNQLSEAARRAHEEAR